jgi:hypothetical protein
VRYLAAIARHFAGPRPIRGRTIRAGAPIYVIGQVIQIAGRPFEVTGIYRRAVDYVDYKVVEVLEPRLLPKLAPGPLKDALTYLRRLWNCLRGCL